jgi:hypothetical protein
MTERRVQFTCTDCGETVDREANQMDVPGLTPTRCVSCTMERLAGARERLEQAAREADSE